MSEQPAGVANVLNLRCRLRSDIAELELPNFGGQVCVAIGDQLACRLVTRLTEAIPQHFPAHAQAGVVGDEA